MGRYGKTLRAVVGEIRKSGDRSPLFWWLVEHYDEIARAAEGRRLQWSSLCARFAEAGLTDLTGKPPSANTAKVTWQRVKRAVAKSRQRQAAELAEPRRVGATPPSRIPRDWRPEQVGQPAQTGPVTAPAPPETAQIPAQAHTVLAAPEQSEKDRKFEQAFDEWLKRAGVPPALREQYRGFYQGAYEHDRRFRFME